MSESISDLIKGIVGEANKILESNRAALSVPGLIADTLRALLKEPEDTWRRRIEQVIAVLEKP